MSARTLMVATVAGALGSGLIGGAFFAFSSFVMRALGKLAPPEGIRAMQSINVVVINPIFLGVFVGTAVLCAALAILTLLAAPALEPRPDTATLLRVAGCLLYLLGCFAVTMLLNVPRNNALAALDASAPSAATYWSTYLRDWTFWNHVRTVAATAGTVLLIAAQLTRSAA